MSVLGTIGAGIGIASGIKNLFSSGNKQSTIDSINGFKFTKDGLVDRNGMSYGDDYYKNRMPTDYYYQQLMNEYNINQQKLMAAQQNKWNQENWRMQFDATNEYNTPAAQAARLLAAGINPTLAMGNEGAIGMAQATSIAPASQSVSGSVGNAGLASADAVRYSADKSLQSSSADLLANSMVRNAAAHKSESEAHGTDIDNMTRNLENLARVRELKSRASSQEEKAALQKLENELLQDTYYFRVNQEEYKTAGLYNDNILKNDIHDMNQYDKNRKYYEAAIAKANFSWLPREKAALIATEYAKARMYGASATESLRSAEKLAEETAGLHLTNEQRNDLDGAFRKATREQYEAVKVELDHAKEMLKQAKYISDHQAIKFWTEQVESISRSFKNITSGVGSVMKPFDNPLN